MRQTGGVFENVLDASVTGVSVRVRPGGQSDTVLIDCTPATATFSDAPLGVGETFEEPKKVRIKTLAASGGTASVSVKFLDDREAPSPPTNLSASQDAAGVHLHWEASTDNFGVTRYYALRDGGTVGYTATTALTDASAKPGQHTYTVYAEDGAGNRSAASAATVVNVADLEPPSAPANVSASQDAAGVHLHWNASTDDVGVSAYLVHRDGAEIGTSETTALTDASAGAGQHTYTVYAEDEAGHHSATSAPAVVNVADLEPPSAPANVSASQDAAGVHLHWNASTDDVRVSAYLVHRDGAEIGTSETTALTDASAGPGQHTYTVYAEDGAGNRSAGSTAILVIRSAGEQQLAPLLRWHVRPRGGIVFEVDARADPDVVKVGLWLNGRPLKVSGGRFLRLAWVPKGGCPHLYRFSARAFDAAGRQASAARRIRTVPAIGGSRHCSYQETSRVRVRRHRSSRRARPGEAFARLQERFG